MVDFRAMKWSPTQIYLYEIGDTFKGRYFQEQIILFSSFKPLYTYNQWWRVHYMHIHLIK